MKKQCYSGQEATEFVLISILVFFSALMVVFIFGGKITDFFTKNSSAVKVTQSNLKTVDPNVDKKYNTPSDPYDGPTHTTLSNKNDYSNLNVTMNDDGSASVVAGGQTVTLSSEIQNLADQISSSSAQTTGSSGKLEVMSEIAKMIETYKSDYPEEKVPVQLSFASSQVKYTVLDDNEDEDDKKRTTEATLEGQAAASTVTVMVGNHIVILQNDKCETDDLTCKNFQTSRRIEGTFSDDGELSGTVIATDGTKIGKKNFKTTNIKTKNDVLTQLKFTIPDPLRKNDSKPRTSIKLNFKQNFAL